MFFSCDMSLLPRIMLFFRICNDLCLTKGNDYLELEEFEVPDLWLVLGRQRLYFSWCKFNFFSVVLNYLLIKLGPKAYIQVWTWLNYSHSCAADLVEMGWMTFQVSCLGEQNGANIWHIYHTVLYLFFNLSLGSEGIDQLFLLWEMDQHLMLKIFTANEYF